MTDKSNKGGKNWFLRHKVLTVIGVILLLGIIGSAGSDKTTNSGNSSKSSTSSPSNKQTSTKIGRPARDGKFEFTIQAPECGVTQVGNDYVNKTAQGQYCKLSVSVKNIGNEPQSLSSFNQYLLDNQNRKFTADDVATSYATPTDQGSSWYNEINPGNTISGILVFDVPKDVTPTLAELHDSPYSGGVKVSLQ